MSSVKSPPKPKRKRVVAQPYKFLPIYVEQAYKLALLGLTIEEMAGVFGVSRPTIDRWRAYSKDFREAIIRGGAAADSDVASRLYQRAMGYSHEAVKILQADGQPIIVPYTEHYPPDTVACIFWLKNRHRSKWADRIVKEVPGGEIVRLIIGDDE